VIEGVLWTVDCDEWYPIIAGVPRFLSGALQPDLGDFEARHRLPAREKEIEIAMEVTRTVATFTDKWRRFRSYGLEPEHRDFLFGWLCKKLGLDGMDDLRAFYRKRRRILEVGPGSGFSARFMAETCPGEIYALDISQAALTCYENTQSLANCTVVQADLMNAPFEDSTFDLIVADGVLHHTPDTRDAVSALYRKLAPDGEFFFYVYKRMGALRQFADRTIREQFTKLSLEDCSAACEAITELGRELSRLDAKITLKSPIPVLDIPAGTHDVQRFVYYNILKCFWNKNFDFETNNMVNFDWYHPQYAWQHSREEVETWLRDLGATEIRFNDANPNGISVIVRKPRI
jgi:SAM-dependent methyltransferase